MRPHEATKLGNIVVDAGHDTVPKDLAQFFVVIWGGGDGMKLPKGMGMSHPLHAAENLPGPLRPVPQPKADAQTLGALCPVRRLMLTFPLTQHTQILISFFQIENITSCRSIW